MKFKALSVAVKKEIERGQVQTYRSKVIMDNTGQHSFFVFFDLIKIHIFKI